MVVLLLFSVVGAGVAVHVAMIDVDVAAVAAWQMSLAHRDGWLVLHFDVVWSHFGTDCSILKVRYCGAVYERLSRSKFKRCERESEMTR